jgi:ANTAR domain
LQSHALIEQAKGMLMFVYGIDADTPFDVLRRQSQQHNVKLRLIAEQTLKDLVELSHPADQPTHPAVGIIRRSAQADLCRVPHKSA